jgi:voltage-dependent potassium channel beta subunit
LPAGRRGEREQTGANVRYRKLGRWGVQVSEVGLGSWLTYGASVSDDVARECIHRAYDVGINFFDTANAYARGRAEEVVGKSLADFPRESYVLATKVYFPMSRRPNDSGLSRKHVFEQAHLSLRRLGMDYIDLYQCHRYDKNTPLEETCRMMDDLGRAGKILYWGVSEWSADQIARAVEMCRREGWAVPVSNQPQYNALWRVIEADVLPTCADVGMGNVVWSPLAGGVLTGKYRSPADIPAGSRASGSDAVFVRRWMDQGLLDGVQQLRSLAERAGCTLPQLALKWCLRERLVSSVIIGATTTAHVDENAAAADIDVDPDVFTQMDEILAPWAITDPRATG